MTDDPTESEAAAFAALLLKTPTEPFKAAIAMFPDDTRRALWVANHWVSHPGVLAANEIIKEQQGEFAGLPDKVELSRKIWERMQGTVTHDGRVIPPVADDFVKLAKLYAEVRSFISKPEAGPTVNVIVPRAIEIPTHGTNEEWESAAEKQQRELLNVSRSRH